MNPSPPHMRDGAISYRLPPPTLGQHTDEVPIELGYAAVDLARFREADVI